MAKKFSRLVLLLCVVTVVGLTSAPIHAATTPAPTNAPGVSSSGTPWFPLVPCGLNTQPAGIDKSVHDYTQPCNQCLLVELGKNLIDMVFYAIVPAIGTLLFLWAGFLILWNARNGSPSGVAEGRKIMTSTAIGIAIVLGAWLITNFILKSIATEQVAATPWYQIECRVGSLKDLTDAAVPVPGDNGGGGGDGGGGGPGDGGGTGGPGDCTDGTVCSDSSLNVCVANTSANCSDSAVNAWDTQLKAAAANNQIGSGIDTVAMLKAIMSQESGGRTDLDSSDGLSYGIFQIRPATGESKKSGCTTAAITATWLKDAANVQASACIAINILKGLTGICGTSVRNLAAGYNGGGADKGACNASTSCASCSVCGTETTMRWECPWDGPDGEHQSCNVDRAGSSFNATRKYAPKVAYCYNKFAGTTGGGGNSEAPTISSMSPSTATAGTEASFDQSTGIETFTYLDVPFEIKGQNLVGSTVSADNVGVDGKPGIEFKDLKYTDISITGDMLMHSTAKDGPTIIIVKKGSDSVTATVDVKITGTQYLARKFADSPNIKFFGRWPGIMPDSGANDLAAAISQGLNATNKSSYNKLSIVTQVYEPSYWSSTASGKYCGGKGFDVAGCASPSDQIIYILGDPEETAPVIVHESAHKLHFYYLGQYAPVPSQPNDFQNKLRQIVDPVVNSCGYLPSQLVNGRILYSDANPTTEKVPRCGFIWAYGTYQVQKNSSSNNYYEDVATLAERNVANFLNPNSGDAVTNPQLYNAEYNLLNQYGF